MKSLELHRDEKKDRISVDCATGVVSVHSRCAYCVHCRGIRSGPRVYPTPQEQVMEGRVKGPFDEALMQAAMHFNTLIRDASAIECDDDANEGYRTRYRH
jgi:hypothetical protein